MERKTVVLLVDDRRRDLMGNVLIAHHLKAHGISAHLETINAWQAVLGAHRPDLILFNHISSSHLARYSRRLHELGVLTGVLPNEGIFYDPVNLEYSSKPRIAEMHCDHFFCWNDVHRDALVRNRFCEDPARIETVGVPRFDFYCEPWKRTATRRESSGRPVILVCGNFPLAHYHELPPQYARDFFGQWMKAIPAMEEYPTFVRINHEARAQFPRFVEALLRTDRYEIIVRPHPREGKEFYERWLNGLPATQRPHVRLAMEESIADLILNCDLQVSCEHCTTALESWIVGQPTVEVLFEKHPFWRVTEREGLNIACTDPDKLVALVEEGLEKQAPAELKARQQAHLKKWCGPTDGMSSKRVADSIGKALESRGTRKPLKLEFNDRRRGLKLKFYRAFDKPYSYFPLHQLIHNTFRPKAHSPKLAIARKSIQPAEVREAAALVESCTK